MTTRVLITDFQLANPMYKGASLSFWTVAAGVVTAVAATLYAGPTGSETLANPQKLDSYGKQKQPIYVEASVAAEIAGSGFPPHTTGIIAAAPSSSTFTSLTATSITTTSLTATSVSINGVASDKDMLTVGTGATTQQGWQFGNYASAQSGLWTTAVTAGNTNYVLSANATLAMLNAPSTSGYVSLRAGNIEQARVTYTAGATNFVTLTGSNGSTPTLGTTGGDLSIAPATSITSVTGVLLVGNGAVGAPSFGFASDTDTGFYRIGSNNIGAAVGGSKVLDIATTGLTVTGALSSTTTLASGTTLTAGTSLSVGTIVLSGNGAVGAPAYSFTSDPDTGIYRIGANNLGIAIGGAKVIDIAATTIAFTAIGGVSFSDAVHVYSATAAQAGGSTGAGIRLGSGNQGLYWGSGAPALEAGQGSIYMRTDGSSTSTRLYVNTNGTTGWTAVTTAT